MGNYIEELQRKSNLIKITLTTERDRSLSDDVSGSVDFIWNKWQFGLCFLAKSNKNARETIFAKTLVRENAKRDEDFEN